MKVVIDVSEQDYQLACNYPDALIATYAHAIKNGIPLDDLRNKMLYDIYMMGVNMDNEYHGCWVRFKNIEKIVDRYMRERSRVND